MKKLRPAIPLVFLSIFLFAQACKENNDKPAQSPVSSYPVSIQPDTAGNTLIWQASFPGSGDLRIHEDKSLGCSIGNLLIVFSGQASKDTIRMDGSDPVEKVVISDLDSDSIPELYILLRSAGSGAYATLLAYQILPQKLKRMTVDNFIDDPDIPGKVREGYRGHEGITVGKNEITVIFPLYRTGDPNADPTGGEAVVHYQLKKEGDSLHLHVVKAGLQ